MNTYEKSCNGMYLEKYNKKGNLVRTAEKINSSWLVFDYATNLKLSGEYNETEFNSIKKHFKRSNY